MRPLSHHRATRRFALIALAPGLLLGCSQSTTPVPTSSPALSLEEPVPAPGESARRIAYVGDQGVVDAPSVATAGQPFVVAVTTYGGGCIAEDTTAVDEHERVADVVPYQRVYHPTQNQGCTMELRIERREVELTFAEPGIATVRVIGRASEDSLVVVARHVAIR